MLFVYHPRATHALTWSTGGLGGKRGSAANSPHAVTLSVQTGFPPARALVGGNR